MKEYFGILEYVEGQPLALGEPLVGAHSKTEFYKPARGLEEAFVSAMLLGMPLLLTGEPGTGKTRAAYWLADQFKARLKRHDVKSDTSGRDLLYRFDEVARFRDANENRTKPLVKYVTFSALGEAILRGIGGTAQLPPFGTAEVNPGEAFGTAVTPPLAALIEGDAELASGVQEHCVVLIDELDKAPRDTPNDLLAEFEDFAFAMPELGIQVRPVEKDGRKLARRPIVIITSNSERSLPPAFLRRCLFFEIPPPEDERTMAEIVAGTLSLSGESMLFGDGWKFYAALRGDPNIGRKPGTAEFLAWLACLMKQAGATAQGGLRDKLTDPNAKATLAALAKSPEDRKQAIERFEGGGWLSEAGG